MLLIVQVFQLRPLRMQDIDLFNHFSSSQFYVCTLRSAHILMAIKFIHSAACWVIQGYSGLACIAR